MGDAVFRRGVLGRANGDTQQQDAPGWAAGPGEGAAMLQVPAPVLGGPFSAGMELPCGYS